MTRSDERGSPARFVAAGAANAVGTYLLYLAALPFIGYKLAYTLSYVAGIALSYVLNARFVFRVAMSAGSAARFPLVYVFQYAAGLALVTAQVEWLSVPAWLAPWIATAVLVPASFLLTRTVLGGK